MVQLHDGFAAVAEVYARVKLGGCALSGPRLSWQEGVPQCTNSPSRRALSKPFSTEPASGRSPAVNLRGGPLSGVLPDAMRFCFDVASAGTPLAGAQLMIDEPQGRGPMQKLRHDEFELADLILLCPCGSADVEVLSGRELMVMSVEVA